MLLVLTVSLVVVGYVYAGYPLLLWVLVRLRGPRPVRRAGITPPISVVISAYNEAAVIRKKLENALALEYPRDRLDIVVISDASDDGTDDIVREYASRGVRLARQPDRGGKTKGLNAVVPTLPGEIVVFSDANAMYRPDALLALVRNFADPEVGCVTGEARYLAGETAADMSERVYWNYEIQIKRLETSLGSMVGGDGAIYGIRRSLWQELPENAINDFLNPLQIVAAGWRAVYEPEAICYEETAGRVQVEFRRRVRIVSRSWRAVFLARGVLNPFRVGLFAWSLFSHKVLRWLCGTFAALGAAAAAALVLRLLERLSVLAGSIVLAAVALSAVTPLGRRAVSIGWYFLVINAASLVGVARGFSGRVSGVWSTARQAESASAAQRLVPAGTIFLATSATMAVAALAWMPIGGGLREAAFVFWGSSAALGYVYVGYPAVLSVARRLMNRSRDKAPIEPSVCLLIAANDEAGVIEAKLRNSLLLDYPEDRFEILVASDGSIDGTNEIVRQFAPRVRLLELSPRRGKTAAINEGMRHVRAEIVVFSDANTFLDRSAVRALVRNFADTQVGAVSGDVVLQGERAALARSEDVYYRYERWIQAAESDIGSMIGVDGALYAIRRALFVPPPEDTILDDMVIPMSVARAGWRVVYEPAARGLERGSDTAYEEFARKSRVIAGAVQFLSRPDSAFPLQQAQILFSLMSHKALRWLSPLFVAGALASSIVLSETSRIYATAATAQTGLLVLAAIGCSTRARRIPIVGLAHYFWLLQCAAVVGVARGIRGRQSVRWRRFNRVPAEMV